MDVLYLNWGTAAALGKAPGGGACMNKITRGLLSLANRDATIPSIQTELRGWAQVNRSRVRVERARPGDRLLRDIWMTTCRARRIDLAVRVEPLLHQIAFTLRRCDWMRCGECQY